MSGRKKTYQVELTQAQQEQLQQLVVARKSPQSLAKRAKALVICANKPDWTDAQVAQEIQASAAWVRKWRKRRCQTQTLEESPRSGRPRKFLPNVRASVTAIACTQPSQMNVHAPKQLLDWLKQKQLEQEWQFTIEPIWLPKYASWLDQIEIWFSIVQRKLLTPNDFPDRETLRERLMEFIAHHNASAIPIKWSYTIAQKQVYFVEGETWIGSTLLAADAVIDDLFKYLVNTPSLF